MRTKSVTLKQRNAIGVYGEYKLISYPRTDYRYYPEEDFQHAKRWGDAARQNYGELWSFPGEPDFMNKSKAWNSVKIGDHFGLRPTEVIGISIAGLNRLEQAIYTKPVLWSRSYFVATVGGASLAILKQYIENQERPE
jgi:DNA topoisomerase IA